MFYIAVCDDDEFICDEIEKCIETYISQRKVTLRKYPCPEDLLKAMNNGRYFDMIFLDIEFGDMSGIDAGHMIRSHLDDQKTHIVYISSYEGYAMELFEIRPMNFLIKPIKREKVVESVEKMFRLSSESGGSYWMQNRLVIEQITYNEIVMFESIGRKINIHHSNGSCFEEYRKLDEIESEVPDRFIRIHKSFLVNMSHVKSWRYESVVLKSGKELTISRNYRKAVRNILLYKLGR